MSLTGVTFANQKVTPSDDGRLYSSMLSDGILTGCDIIFTAATLSIAAGSLLIGGRELRTSGETLSITGATSGFARVLIDIDLTQAATKDSFEQAQWLIQYAASTDAFAALETQDINSAGTHFQAVFCVMSLGSVGIASIVHKLGNASPFANNAGAHNSIYRGRNLGSSVTAAQWAAIEAGTFDDLYIGDYWVINGVNWRIAAFDYYLNTGDTMCTTHHVVIVPDTALYSGQMNSARTTVGGYVGSNMYISGLNQAKEIINAAFGAAHILSHRQYLCNAVSDGAPSGGSWYDSVIELMTDQNLYGSAFIAYNNSGNTPRIQTLDKSQFPLFAHAPQFIAVSSLLRNIARSDLFTCSSNDGIADVIYADSTTGVRPSFSIKA